MTKYSNTPAQGRAINNLQIALGKPVDWLPKALEVIACDLVVGSHARDGSQTVARAEILNDIATTFEAREVKAMLREDTPASRQAKAILRSAQASINAALGETA